jgi:hypothetical protein
MEPQNVDGKEIQQPVASPQSPSVVTSTQSASASDAAPQTTPTQPQPQPQPQPNNNNTGNNADNNERRTKTFTAICDFVDSLWEVFPSPPNKQKRQPFALYHRIVERAKDGCDEAVIDKVIKGFASFFESHKSSIISNQMDAIPKGAVVKYNDSDIFYMPIQKFIYQSDDDTKDIIRKHLLNICSLISGDSEVIDVLGKDFANLIDTSTEEGKIINSVAEKAIKAAREGGNPLQSLMSGGGLAELMSSFQGKEIDQTKMLGVMENFTSNMFKMLRDMNEEGKK